MKSALRLTWTLVNTAPFSTLGFGAALQVARSRAAARSARPSRRGARPGGRPARSCGRGRRSGAPWRASCRACGACRGRACRRRGSRDSGPRRAPGSRRTRARARRSRRPDSARLKRRSTASRTCVRLLDVDPVGDVVLVQTVLHGARAASPGAPFPTSPPKLFRRRASEARIKNRRETADKPGSVHPSRASPPGPAAIPLGPRVTPGL